MQMIKLWDGLNIIVSLFRSFNYTFPDQSQLILKKVQGTCVYSALIWETTGLTVKLHGIEKALV